MKIFQDGSDLVYSNISSEDCISLSSGNRMKRGRRKMQIYISKHYHIKTKGGVGKNRRIKEDICRKKFFGAYLINQRRYHIIFLVVVLLASATIFHIFFFSLLLPKQEEQHKGWKKESSSGLTLSVGEELSYQRLLATK